MKDRRVGHPNSLNARGGGEERTEPALSGS